jgi:hypothetical protein
MHVEILVDTPNHKAGTRVHLDAATCRTLIALGFAREVARELPPVAVSWIVRISELTGAPEIFASCSHGCAIFRFLGKPEFAHLNKFIHGHAAPPEDIPQNIIEQYRKAYDTAVPTATSDDYKLAAQRQRSQADINHENVYGVSRFKR